MSWCRVTICLVISSNLILEYCVLFTDSPLRLRFFVCIRFVNKHQQFQPYIYVLEYPKPDMASAGYDANSKDGGLFIYFKTEHVLT